MTRRATLVALAVTLCAARAWADVPPAAVDTPPPLLPPAAVLPPWPLRPYLLLDADYQLHGNDAEGYDGFALTRARFGVTAAPFPWLGAVFVGEYARESVSLLDGFAVARVGSSGLDVSVGYERNPLFVTGHDEFEFQLAVPERSVLAQSLWPGRDLGVTAHWLVKRLPIEIWARVGNGSGTLLAPQTDAPAGTLRADLVLGRGDPRAPRSRTWGLRAGAAVYVASLPPDVPGLGATLPNGFLFYRPGPVSGLRAIGEWHIVLQGGPVQLTVEAGASREERSHDTGGNPSAPRVAQDPVFAGGASGELAWMLTGQHRRVGAWPWEARGARPWGGWEVAARAERFVIGLGAADVTPGGVSAGAVALRWWANDWFAMALAGYAFAYDRAPIEEPAQNVSWLALLRATLRVQ